MRELSLFNSGIDKQIQSEPLSILIGMESSGTIRDAFIGKGHLAQSCDLLPTEKPGPHYEGDVFDIIAQRWDIFIFHPECTYLCSSGLHWNKKRPERQLKTDASVEFVHRLWKASEHIPLRCMENPIGCLSTRFRKPSQIIQPYHFGEDASKATCLWLQGLPRLLKTVSIPPRLVEGRPRWGNQTDSGQNKLAPGPHRWRERSRTYSGIAIAMADQWTKQQLNF